MEKIFSILMLYYLVKYFILLTLVTKGYEKYFLEIVLSILPWIFFTKFVMEIPYVVMLIIETEFIVSNILLLLNVILIKKISFIILVSVINDGVLSKILCNIFNKKRLCKRLKELQEIDYGPKLKIGIPAMAGKIHKKTKIKFDRWGFPKFKVFCTIKLKVKDYKKSREIHFDYANKKMYKKILKNKNFRKLFTKKEVEELRRGETPTKYTWHHHQDKGKMQLVSRKVHSEVNHIGGYSIWGGGKNE